MNEPCEECECVDECAEWCDCYECRHARAEAYYEGMMDTYD